MSDIRRINPKVKSDRIGVSFRLTPAVVQKLREVPNGQTSNFVDDVLRAKFGLPRALALVAQK